MPMNVRIYRSRCSLPWADGDVSLSINIGAFSIIAGIAMMVVMAIPYNKPCPFRDEANDFKTVYSAGTHSPFLTM
jgi:hypothetical protein